MGSLLLSLCLAGPAFGQAPHPAEAGRLLLPADLLHMASDTHHLKIYGIIDGQKRNIVSARILPQTVGIAPARPYLPLPQLADGPHTLIIYAPERKPLTLRLVYPLNPNVIQAHAFEWAHHQSQEIELHARPDAGQLLEKVTLAPRDMQVQRGLPLAEALTRLPGMASFNTGPNISKPMMRGMTGNRLVIMNNGIRLEGQQWGNEHAPEIDPYLADEITLVKGANSVAYGPDAIAGAILVNPARLPFREYAQPHLNVRANLDGFSNGRGGAGALVLNGMQPLRDSLGQLAWRAHGSSRRLGNVYVPGNYLTNTGVSDWNGSLALGWQKPLRPAHAGELRQLETEVFYSRYSSDIGIYREAHIGNLSDLQARLANPGLIPEGSFSYGIDRPWQQISHDLAKLRSRLLLNSHHWLQLQLSQQYNQRREYDLHRPRRPGSENEPQMYFQLYTQQAELVHHGDYDLPRGLALHSYSGVSWQTQANIMQGRQLIPNFRNYTYSAFSSGTLHGRNWLFDAGLRGDLRTLTVYRYEADVLEQPSFQFANLSANAGFSYNPHEDWQLALRGSRAWRPPTVNELFSDGVHHGTATYELGNHNLGSERAWGSEASLAWQRPAWAKLKVQATVFRNWFDNYIYQQPQYPETRQTIRGAFPLFAFVQVPAVIEGIELEASATPIEIDELEELSLTLGVQGSLVRGRSQQQPLIFMPADRLRLFARQEWGQWWAQAGLLLVDRQWRVPAQADFAPAPAGYALLDAAIGTKLGRDLELSLAATNLTNRNYRDYLNRLRYFAPDAGINISAHLVYRFHEHFHRKRSIQEEYEQKNYWRLRPNGPAGTGGL